MKKTVFVTLFPNIENIHLVKDVGMIPYCLKKYYNYDSGIVVYKNEDYPYFDQDVSSLKKYYFPFKKGKYNKLFNSIMFLLFNSKKIDVLHLYHPGERISRILASTYLFLNKKGLVYFHMDENGSDTIEDFFSINGKSIKSKIKRLLFKLFAFKKNNVNRILFGIQNKHCLELINNQYPFNNIEYIPDAYEDTTGNNETIKKENIILFVGRVGAPQKRTDILLEGFKKAYPSIKEWNLKIVGPIDNEFNSYLSSFKKHNSKLMNNIEFTGPIYDRLELKREYGKAKIFYLTSDYESFGLVLVEALANECAIVSSNIISSKEIICDDKFGKLFEKGDIDDFSKKLVSICNDTKLQKYVSNNAKEYIQNNFSYRKSLIKLNEWIKKNIK